MPARTGDLPLYDLPAQMAHHGLRRHARSRENARERRTVGIAASAELLGMNAGSHEQAVNTESRRALEIGAYRIADRQHTMMLHAFPARGLGKSQCLLVDGAVWFAGEDDLAARGHVEIGNRARAIDELVTALDHDVGIGADHRESARAHSRDEILVILGRLHRIVEESRADRIIGVLQWRERRMEDADYRSEEHTSELQSRQYLVCRLLL